MNSSIGSQLVMSPKARAARYTLAVLIIATLFAPRAESLIVMNLDDSGNRVAPTTTTLPDYADPDPGWANATNNGVYLGNGWVIAAAHAVPNNISGEALNNETFGVVPGTLQTLKNPKLLTDAGLTSDADLRMFRLDSREQFSGTPEQRAIAQSLEIQSIAIGSSTLSTNKPLVIIGNGRVRQDPTDLLHWDSPKSPVSWGSPESCDGCIHSTDPSQVAPNNQLHALGYARSSNVDLVWGTNKVENSSSVAGILDGFSRVGTSSTYALTSLLRDVAAQSFDFDEYTFEYEFVDGVGTPISGGGNEAQGADLDSGSGVYSWNGSEWELNGVMHSIGSFISQTHAVAIREDRGNSPDRAFGDVTVFSDFSVYRDQIEAYLAPPEGFEFTGQGEDTRFFHLVDREFGYDTDGSLIVTNPGLWGDVNLDGQVSGDGTGAWDNDDVTAFVDGWGWQQASGDIFSWKRGDLNQDGVTDLADFILLRSGLNGETAGQINLASLLAGTDSVAIPEPSSWLLAALAGFALLGAHQRAIASR